MTQNGKLRAWIEQHNGEKVIAGFIGVATLPDGQHVAANREPATRICPSADTARQWIESEAAAFGLPVEWVDSDAQALR